jgi:hypothetical protein
MYTIFHRIELGKEHPAICKMRQYTDGRISYPAEMFVFDRIKSGAPWFFNISTFWVPSPGDRFRARVPHIAFTYAVVLDDVGDHPKSKVSWDALSTFPLKPNYILATREAAGRYNCQAGYLLAPTEPVKATRLINAFIERGLSDPGMRSPNRWARLPGSTKHDSNFPATLLEWNP